MLSANSRVEGDEDGPKKPIPKKPGKAIRNLLRCLEGPDDTSVLETIKRDRQSANVLREIDLAAFVLSAAACIASALPAARAARVNVIQALRSEQAWFWYLQGAGWPLLGLRILLITAPIA